MLTTKVEISIFQEQGTAEHYWKITRWSIGKTIGPAAVHVKFIPVDSHIQALLDEIDTEISRDGEWTTAAVGQMSGVIDAATMNRRAVDAS